MSVSQPDDLQASVPYVTLNLPDSTMQLAYNSVKVYRPVFVISDHEMQMQIGLKVGEDSIQLASVSPCLT